MQTLLTPLLNSGKASVYIFCMLGGFLITSHYKNITHQMQFMQKRYIRLYPVLIALTTSMFIASILKLTYITYLTVLTLTVCSSYILKEYVSHKIFFWVILVMQISIYITLFTTSILHMHSNAIIRSVMSYLMYIGLAFPITGKPITMHFTYYWTLWFEVVFYWLYAYIFVHIVRQIKTVRDMKRFVFFGSVFTLAVCITLTQYVTQPLIAFNWHFYHLARGYVWWYFFCGVTLGLIIQTPLAYPRVIQKILEWPWTGSITGVSYFILTSFVNQKSVPFSIQMYTDILFSGLLIIFFYTLTKGYGHASQLMKSPLLCWYGSISYPFYLLHVPVLLFISPRYWRIAQGMPAIGTWLLVFVITSTLSYIVHELLEK